jgi:hypothetical protein
MTLDLVFAALMTMMMKFQMRRNNAGGREKRAIARGST